MLNEGHYWFADRDEEPNSPKLYSFVDASEWKENFDISQWEHLIFLWQNKPETASATKHRLHSCLAVCVLLIQDHFKF